MISRNTRAGCTADLIGHIAYPVSPAGAGHQSVDMARQIEQADRMVNVQVNAKLHMIAIKSRH